MLDVGIGREVAEFFVVIEFWKAILEGGFVDEFPDEIPLHLGEVPPDHIFFVFHFGDAGVDRAGWLESGGADRALQCFDAVCNPNPK